MGGATSSETNSKTNEMMVPDNDSAQEMYMPGRGRCIDYKTTTRVASGVCKIQMPHGTGSGFFGVIRHRALGEMYGLFTNNHVINFDYLHSRNPVLCMVSGQSVSLSVDGYCFTCEFMDATFIEISPLQRTEIERNGCLFLYTTAIRSTIGKGSTIQVAQHPKGGDLCLAIDIVDGLWGFDIFHKASTDYGSSGSPVADENGTVVGIHKRRCQITNRNVAVNMYYVTGAILRDVARDTERSHLPLQTLPLSSRHVNQLAQIGLLHVTENLFVSPASFEITPIWFMRSFHSWFWTPTDPNDKQLCREPRDANWMKISLDDNLKVVGGYWHGQVPAPKNVKIIRFLQRNGNEYLMESRTVSNA